MAGRDPILPNAGIIARREYRERTRSPLFVVSTIVLAGLAMMAALAPIGIRSIDRQTVTRIAIVSSDAELANRAVAIADSVLNVPPAGVTDANFKRPYVVEVATDRDAAEARLATGRLGGVLDVERLASGQIDVALKTFESANSQRSQILSVAAFGIGVIDWNARLPPSDTRAQFLLPLYRVETLNTAIEGDKPIDAQQAASRGFLGIVFVVLLFITIVIYGMWVATGVAAEKSSRVMELMISAASPRQMMAGKVVGIGAAGLTQYLAIAAPALILLGFQDRIAEAVLGPDWAAGTQLVGLTPALLAGYGVFFLLGFALFALIYAAMGSFVSRPDDLQTLSLPLSLVAMVGYLTAIVALGGAGGMWVTVASFVPPFSPFVMLARIMVSAVEPWEVVASVVLLVAAIAVVAVVATRMYAAGVLLYGQRPGLRAFVAAARRV
ncbi:MAG TPA: ABC transporter permease [Candidatus Limnocylindrales bacterium]|jgi:ABC-2 type transport system permease protein|nr:ABC transporter permease [Candidatus Limnocylindrales bacterium]